MGGEALVGVSLCQQGSGSVAALTRVVLCSLQAADSAHMVSVPMAWVKEGGMVRLDKKYLRTDYGGVSSDHIVYTLQAAEGQPRYGTRRPRQLVDTRP